MSATPINTTAAARGFATNAILIATLMGSILGVAAHPALAAQPSLGSIEPQGIQRGRETVVTYHGERLRDAQEILFHSPGFTVTNLEAGQDGHVKATIKVADDASLGEHIMRVRTASGITPLRTLFVEPYPAVAETEPNSDFDKPQKVLLNTVVTGVVQNEDVDYYMVENVKKGQRISAELVGIRLGRVLFDAYLAIMNARRFELAASDDSALFVQDPVTSIVAPEDGNYVVQVREAAYGGDDNSRYRLLIGTFPRPLAVYPPGGKAGTDVQVTFIGDQAGQWQQTFKLPDQRRDKYGLIATHNGDDAPSANPFRVSTFDNVLEAEPNNQLVQATATDLPLPVAFNGIIGNNGDVDYFTFDAKKGQSYDVHVFARRLRSPLDSVLHILDAGAKVIAGDDDSARPDSYVRFNVPADGAYSVRVRDHLDKGGPDYTYRVEMLPIAPELSTAVPSLEQNAPQHRITVPVPRGNRYQTLVDVGRANFSGPVRLLAPDLPEGITMHAPVVPNGVGRVAVMFEAAPDAPIAGKLIDLIAAPVDEKNDLRGYYSHTIPLIYENNTGTFYSTHIRKLAVAVGEEAPFTIRIIEPRAPVVRRGSMNLRVVVERKEGFTKPIHLKMMQVPGGIGAANDATIAQDSNETVYPINASGDAGVGPRQVSLLGWADVGYGSVYVSTPMARFRVAEPYVDMKIDMAAAELGKPVEVVCNLTQRTPFEGEGRLQLLNLPGLTSTTEKVITKDDREVVFEVQVEPKAPTGQHKSLFCSLVLMDQGEPVYHNIGHGGVLRIDPPPPPPKKKSKPRPVAKATPKEKPKPEPKKQDKPKKKRLTRLEKLRLEAKKRREESTEG